MGRVSHSNSNGGVNNSSNNGKRVSEVEASATGEEIGRCAAVASRMDDGEMKGTLADQHGHGVCPMPAFGGTVAPILPDLGAAHLNALASSDFSNPALRPVAPSACCPVEHLA